jgi:hypothetical protein
MLRTRVVTTDEGEAAVDSTRNGKKWGNGTYFTTGFPTTTARSDRSAREQGGRSGNGNRGVTKVLLGIVCPLAGPGNAVGRERQAPLEREKDAPLATIPHPKVVPVPVAHAKSYTICNPATGDLLIRLGP